MTIADARLDGKAVDIVINGSRIERVTPHSPCAYDIDTYRRHRPLGYGRIQRGGNRDRTLWHHKKNQWQLEKRLPLHEEDEKQPAVLA